MIKWISRWSVKKPIYIDCYTSRSYVYKYAPIATANNFLPDWWKALPKEFIDEQQGNVPASTLKRCAGLIDLYGKGLVIPIWSDLRIQMHGDGGGTYRYNYSDLESTMTQHMPAQLGTFSIDNHIIFLKIDSPWLFECAENIDWHWSQPVWNYLAEKDFCVLPGVLNFKYTNETNINIMLKPQDNVINIGHGMPLAHVIPLSDRPIKIRNHLISIEEFNRKKAMQASPIVFVGKHYKQMKILKKQKSKCPFGFGSNT